MAAAPTADALGKAFCTPSRQPWVVSPENSPASRMLRAPADAVFSLRGLSALTVQAQRAKGGSVVVRLRWALHSRLGGIYMPPAPVTVPVGAAQAITVDLDTAEADLIPVGHQRPWDSLAAGEIVALELRAECSSPPAGQPAETISLLVSDVALERSAPATKPPVIMDLALRSPPAGSRAAALLTFRIEPPPRDPYAADGDGDVRVALPDGQEVLAFFDQRYLKADDGAAKRNVASARPGWCAYLPGLPADGAIAISSGQRTWRVLLGDRELAPSEAPMPQTVAAAVQDDERWHVPLETPCPDVRTLCAGLPPPCVLTGAGEWQPVDELPGRGKAAAATVWRPVPFWHARWGEFAGAWRPDVALARRMDEVLARAAAAGQVQPMAILDGSMFERQGTFNWDSHPLHDKLAGPGELYRTPEGMDFCQRWIRYCVARWGMSRAVSALWLTPILSAPGASEFHARLAPVLRSWTHSLPVPVATLHPFARAPKTVRASKSFQGQETSLWKPDPRLGACASTIIAGGGSDGSPCLELQAQTPQATVLNMQATYVTPVMDWRATPPDDFTTTDALQFDIRVPPTGPPDLRIGMHLRDRDGLWFETLLPNTPQPGDWNTVTLDVSGANAHGLKAAGHKKAWTDYSRQRLVEIGLCIYSTHPNWTPPAEPGAKAAAPLPLTVRLGKLRAVRFPPGSRPVTAPAITLLNPPAGAPVAPAQLYRGDLWQCQLNVSKTFANPFDATQCDLTAVITTPSGKQVRIPAFFDEACERREEKPGGAEVVEPVGAEFFTVRYRAVEAGPYKATVELREGGKYEIVEHTWQSDQRYTPDGHAQEKAGQQWGRATYQLYPDGRRLVERIRFVPGPVTATLKLGEPAFAVASEPRPGKEPFHGFVRVSADKRHFEYDDGTFFYPIGPSLRSPSDSRIPYVDQKWNPTEIARLGRRGTYQYDDYLAECGKAGINWARVWMCPWWCGLEWRRDWPGYQGCGRYNLLNAWRMDYLIDLAAQKNMVYEICVTNHGQYSLHVDTDWPNNPYSAKLGGPLVAASEFFTRADTQAALKNRLRYVIARYGHSPNVMAWGLLSEVEWLEEYEPSISGYLDKPAVNVEAWHSDVATFMKDLDANRHLVTTHFARPVRGTRVLALPALDYATSNAYSFFEELGSGAYDASAALADYWGGNARGFRGFSMFGKPALVGEQGRHWLGGQYSTKLQLDADLHAGLWGSMVQPLGGATGYWWWLHLHFDNRYGDYQALAAFMRGEDMRPAQGETLPEPKVLSVTSPGNALRARALASDRRLYAWVYHQAMPRGESAPDMAGGVLNVGPLKPGKYDLEFWNTSTGAVIEKRELTVAAGETQVPLPVVVRDLALKLKPSAAAK